ncbi:MULTISPECIES: alpha/beta fold hydrolase [Streptomyces]|uniref:Alpha/beta hydrolase n=1 Tax=Streptomyces parvulus TaxID=146923 RepID=A0A191VAJ1_9ACTN|nr:MULTISPECIES: alpha/beta hydrolase [Streptomyces]ANJ12044.1 alpha/beta hydrolase [Streptomyces parvulus]MZD59244.1 alpha/beta fold hydrolase [Streptomyces sp. SID5606]GGS05836.1 alpha/beta hydrolase [Streptomyces parvulus]
MNASAVARPTRKRVAVAGTLAAVAALTLSAMAPAGATTAGHDAAVQKPTVVLVHGAFADSSSWNGVIERLRKDGYPVVAPANPLRGLKSDADYVKSFLKSVEGPVVLAGHSYGGAVISEAAAGEPDVEALVYIAAFAPEKGETALGLSNKYPGSTLGPTLNSVPFPLPGGGTGQDLYIKADSFHQQFAADVPTRVSDLMAATQRPVAASALEEPAAHAAWKDIPSWNLVTTQDLNIPAAAQRFMARRAHSHTTEIKASHAVTVSRPDAAGRVIEQAARATAGH